MRRTGLAFLVTTFTAGFLGPLSPGSAGAAGNAPVPKACVGWEARSEQVREFVAANPQLVDRSPQERLAAFRARGMAEWRDMLVAGLRLNVAGAEDDDDDGDNEDRIALTPTFSVEGSAALDARTGYRLAAQNPLVLMRRFLVAYDALRSGDDALALQIGEGAVRDGQGRWGSTNAGLVLGYTVLASSQFRTGELKAAGEAADLGLAAIAEHPERGVPLASFRAGLLDLRAKIADGQGKLPSAIKDPRFPPDMLRKTALEGRSAAAAERRLRVLPFGSPYFNLPAIFPGLQPLARWSEQADDIQLPLLGSFVNAATVMAAVTPSVSIPHVRDNNPGNLIALTRTAGSCLRAASSAGSGGDFVAATKANAELLGLVNEANLIMAVHDIEHDRDGARADAVSDAWSEATRSSTDSDEDSDGGSGANFEVLGLAQINGEIPELARRLEKTLTPRAAYAIFKYATADQEKADRK
ncbi:MAG: hypothetical protein JWO25_2677, partial [Alphaproteobacteria bacterium]|nr:hypothetical protein [Alphaproteobacteria bacterium]